LDLVWGQEVYVEDWTVDAHIHRLRKALDLAGAKGPIRTIRGAGYALNTDD
jgi:two-component system phosphate regulon response regulator PhoB